jgi:hypothetical protein
MDSSTHQQNFLSTLAEGIPAGSYFHVAQAVGDGFHNEVWRENLLEGPWYFFTGASVNRKHRRRSDLVAVRAIVIDDVGTKVDSDKLKAAPTWILETSPGNYQWGYMLKTWDADIPKADALFKALVEAGLQDKGVNTACRLFRIPGSINLKKGRDNFAALLHTFDHERVYTLNTLAKALGVRPGKPIEPKLDTGERPGAGRPDPFLEWLQAKGLWTNEATGGWHLIQCPFASEHTDDRVDAKYLPTFASMDGKRKVECHHGHGEDKAAYFTRFMEWAAAEGAPDDGPDPAKLREMFAAIRTEPVEPRVAATSGSYDNFKHLIADLGPIPKSCFPHAVKGSGDKYKPVQPCVVHNVEAGLAHLGVGVRLNLMTAGISYTLPERIDRSRFGVKTQGEVDEMVNLSLKAIFNEAGIANEQKLDGLLAGLANASYWHPAKDWIESKPWDGQDRLQHLLRSVSTADPDLFEMYFRRWALQGIEAACGWEVRRKQQKSLCLVLAGRQGIGKSRWLASLVPEDYFVGGKHLSLDSYSSRDSKHEALQGMIAELGELDTTFGKSATGSLKAFISEPTDVYRLPYAASQLVRPRCTSFAATVNDDKFLQDDTGSRRFAVVWVDHCDADHCTDLQQFWAQMHHYWQDKNREISRFWLEGDEEKAQATSNAQFQAVDAIDEMVRMEIERRSDRDVYACECSLNATGVGLLLELRVEDKGMPRRIAAACRRVMGEWANFRKRGGTAESWAFWLTATEAKNMGVSILRPKKA